MTNRSAAIAAVAERMALRPVGIDDWSAIRHLHTIAFERLVGPTLETEMVAALRRHVSDPHYTAELQRESLWTAWLDGLLVGTSGWLPSDDTGHSARITSVFVHPVFPRLGIGRLLVRNAESRARNAGFTSYTTRAPESAAPFFISLGYEISSHGVSLRLGERSLPVAFLRRAAAKSAIAGDDRAEGATAGRMILTGSEH